MSREIYILKPGKFGIAIKPIQRTKSTKSTNDANFGDRNMLEEEPYVAKHDIDISCCLLVHWKYRDLHELPAVYS